MLTDIDKIIISHLQCDLPLSLTPYANLAKELEMEEKDLLAKIKELKEKGVLRRMGAILHHQQAGFAANGMCAWRVLPERLQEVGTIMAAVSQASHVYQRPTYPDWPYNLFTMIHARTEKECAEVVLEMAKETDISDYIILYSTREFKKTSMKYF